MTVLGTSSAQPSGTISSPSAITPTPWEQTNISPTQTMPAKFALPTIPQLSNPFVTSPVTPQVSPSVDVNNLTAAKPNSPLLSPTLLNLGSNTGQIPSFNVAGLPPSSNNILSLNGINQQTIQNPQTLQNPQTIQNPLQNPQVLQNPQMLQLTGLPPEEITKINSLEQQILGQQVLNEKIKAVAPKVP